MIREQDGERGLGIMLWDVLGGQAAWPMTGVYDRISTPATDSPLHAVLDFTV